jgi:hypothetical protein
MPGSPDRGVERKPPSVEGSKLTPEQREDIARGEEAMREYWKSIQEDRDHARMEKMVGKRPSTPSSRTGKKYD